MFLFKSLANNFTNRVLEAIDLRVHSTHLQSSVTQIDRKRAQDLLKERELRVSEIRAETDTSFAEYLSLRFECQRAEQPIADRRGLSRQVGALGVT